MGIAPLLSMPKQRMLIRGWSISPEWVVSIIILGGQLDQNTQKAVNLKDGLDQQPSFPLLSTGLFLVTFTLFLISSSLADLQITFKSLCEAYAGLVTQTILFLF